MRVKILLSLAIVIISAAPLFVTVLGSQKSTGKNSSGNAMTVILYNDQDFKGYNMEYTFQENCLELDGVSTCPSPASSAKLKAGRCVRLCNVSCEDQYLMRLKGETPYCIELAMSSTNNELSEIKFPQDLNDKVRSISRCPGDLSLLRSGKGKGQRSNPIREEEPSSKYDNNPTGFQKYQQGKRPKKSQRFRNILTG